MQLTFLSEEPPAKATASPDSERDWMIRVATSCLPMLQLLGDTGPRGWSGRTSSVSFQATKDELLQAFWDSSPDDESKSPQTDGKLRALSTATKALTASHGASLTLNLSEQNAFQTPSHSVDGVSSLSDILETGDVPPRFFLSGKACRGILRRAEKRGKALPEQLAHALAQAALADWEPTSNSTED